MEMDPGAGLASVVLFVPKIWDAFLNPVVIFLRSVPMGALFPLTLILFSEARQKTLFLFLAIVGFVVNRADADRGPVNARRDVPHERQYTPGSYSRRRAAL